MTTLRRAALFAIGCSWIVAVAAPARADQTMLVVRNARLYSGPSATATRIRVLHPPEIVTRDSTAATGHYIHVRTSDGVPGWVYDRFLAAVQAVVAEAPGEFPQAALRPLGPDEMRIHFINVGQGACTLFEFPCGAMLVDTGGEKNDEFDGTEALRDYLTAFFDHRADLDFTLDLLVITHPHLDHTRGIRTVLDNFQVRNVVDDSVTTGSGAPQQRVLERFATDNHLGYAAMRLSAVAGGFTSAIVDPFACAGADPKIRVLWGKVDTNLGWSATNMGNENNHSVVLRVDFGESSCLVTGDLEDTAIDDLLSTYQGTGLLDVDIYEAGHHGSSNGTTDDLIAAMTPEVAVICMGNPSRQKSSTAWAYGHPNKGIVESLVQGVSGHRSAVNVPVGSGQHNFSPFHLSAGVYGTGWDGTVIVDADKLGHVEVLP